jgi:TadE-like protein
MKGPVHSLDSSSELAAARAPFWLARLLPVLPRISRRLRAESGQSVVEFALIVPLLCTLVLVFVDFGKAMNYWIDLTHGANEGARLAAVNVDVTKAPYSAMGASSLQEYVKKGLETGELRSGSIVSICFPSGTSAGSPVTIQVTYPYKWIPFIGGTLNVKGRATMRLEHDATNFSALGTCA